MVRLATNLHGLITVFQIFCGFQAGSTWIHRDQFVFGLERSPLTSVYWQGESFMPGMLHEDFY